MSNENEEDLRPVATDVGSIVRISEDSGTVFSGSTRAGRKLAGDLGVSRKAISQHSDGGWAPGCD